MNKKGFTIAEMLVALMVISLVLSAAIPTISKKNVGADGSGLGAG
ncbi:prepilin-type N-terminal cleavage/methylation domain-containing protein, partial [bacterium]|nr:prepilin-type N-terminal cleavage/methylation domain-containing protein [bacterium]